MSDAPFVHALRAMQPEAVRANARLVPTSFDPLDAELSGFPLPHSYQWKTLASFLGAASTQTLLSRLPLYWQLTSIVRDACAAAGSSLFLSDIDNMPGAAAAVHGADANVVLTTSGDARSLAAFLADHTRTQPDAWFIVHPANGLERVPTLTGRLVAEEVHLIPGVPLFEQCAALYGGTGRFHRSALFSWTDDTLTWCGSRLTFPPLCTPLRMRETARCACGQAIYERV